MENEKLHVFILQCKSFIKFKTNLNRCHMPLYLYIHTHDPLAYIEFFIKEVLFNQKNNIKPVSILVSTNNQNKHLLLTKKKIKTK